MGDLQRLLHRPLFTMLIYDDDSDALFATIRMHNRVPH